MKAYVLGSINMDLVIDVSKMPSEGETVHGSNFFMNPGGKGANQAVAVAKGITNTNMIGCVGSDFSNTLITNLKRSNVRVDHVKTLQNMSSGIAVIVNTHGENRIILDKGANFSITKEDVDLALSSASPKDFIIMQLEIPLEIVEYGLNLAKEKGLTTVLNPVPSIKFDEKMFSKIDYLILNQGETQFYSGIYPTNQNDALEAAILLKNKGVKNILITLGSNGSFFYFDQPIYQGRVNVDVVDTTAAGDTYIGFFISKIMEGKSVVEAMKTAAHAAALTISKKGAQNSIPTMEEVQLFEKNSKY